MLHEIGLITSKTYPFGSPLGIGCETRKPNFKNAFGNFDSNC